MDRIDEYIGDELSSRSEREIAISQIVTLLPDYILGKTEWESFTDEVRRIYNTVSYKIEDSEIDIEKFKDRIYNIVEASRTAGTGDICFKPSLYTAYAKYVLPIYTKEIIENISDDTMLEGTKIANYIQDIDSFSLHGKFYQQELNEVANGAHNAVMNNLSFSELELLKMRCNLYFGSDIGNKIPISKIISHNLILKIGGEEAQQFYNSENMCIQDTFNELAKGEHKLYQLYKDFGKNLMKYTDSKNKREFHEFERQFYTIKNFIKEDSPFGYVVAKQKKYKK